ncbi:MAG: DUF378 domain-containing protein [Candidatus Buchananbacteria bacterium]
MKAAHIIAFILVIIGALNWLLVGLFSWDLVVAIFGSWPVIVKIIYVIVGLAAIYEIAIHKQNCKACASKVQM